jgi:hypothetical protein
MTVRTVKLNSRAQSELEPWKPLPNLADCCGAWFCLPLVLPPRLIQSILGEIPTRSAQHLEITGQEPRLARLAVRNSPQRLLARPTPSIGSTGVGVVTPEESHNLARINCMRDVGASEANPLSAVYRANDFIRHSAFPEPNLRFSELNGSRITQDVRESIPTGPLGSDARQEIWANTTRRPHERNVTAI